MVGTRHILGLAVDDAGVVATELSVQSGQAKVVRTGEFLWDQELTAESAKPLGQRLRQFLREQGFSARRAVVGLAAKWVLSKEIDAPPASPEVLSGMLSIQAERAFSLNAEELIFDYCGQTSTTEKSQVLLLAARRQIVQQIRELLEAAGLQVQSITLSALACSRVLAEGGVTSWYGLYARPTYCEFWAQLDGSPRFLKHVPLAKNGTPKSYADLLASTIERLVLLSPMPGQTPPYRITAYDACGLPDGALDGLGKRLAPQMTVANGRAGRLSRELGLPDQPEQARTIAAAAVALTAVAPHQPPVDFLNPRVGAKPAASHKRLFVWGGGIAAACLLGLIILLGYRHACTSAIAADEAWLQANQAQIAQAQEIVERAKYAASWDSRQPWFLACLKALTTAFPAEGSIWASSLALNENGTGSVIGKATSKASFYDVLDKIKQNKVFPMAEMTYCREVGRESQDQEFAIKFTFGGAK